MLMKNSFKNRRDFIQKSIVLAFGTGVTGNLSILDEIMKNSDPAGLQKENLNKLLENSPKTACTKKADAPKEGCCGWDGMNYTCNDKK